ncbi:hypothetical protein BASA81_004417 [Batrachochytrium salamandrivorans]|nr:hypothetical protein BASA81_004417 [Batrachochytrium salamandrivorans]
MRHPFAPAPINHREHSLLTLLAHAAALGDVGDDERSRTLCWLGEALDPSDRYNNKATSQVVLNNMAVMDILLYLSATTSPADVVEDALWVLLLLAFNVDNAEQLFQEHPSLVPVAMRKLEFGAENATEDVQTNALKVLRNLAANVNNKREMATKNPMLVTLLMVQVDSNSEIMQESALSVLCNLAANVNNAHEMVVKNPKLVPLLMVKAESNLKQVQINAWVALLILTISVDNKREMVTQNPTLVPLLVAKVESNSEQVKNNALIGLNSLAINVNNATEMMAAYSAVLLPLLVENMSRGTPLEATKMVYQLSCSPANRAILRENMVAALTKGRENKDVGISLFSLLALVNLFGAEENSKVLKTNLTMLQRIFGLIARAMNKDGWSLNKPLLAFRYLCVVEHNRQLLWGEYGSKFLTSVLVALQQAIDDKDLDAAENAMSTLAQFSNDTKPLAWMRSNKPQLDKVIAQLAPFPEALKTAQFLLLAVDPPKVVAAPVTGSKPTIMISYNWKHQAQARLIHALLESQGYPVWRDEQNMKGNIIDAMTDAVSKSTVVLVLVSPFYKDSVNCRKECEFADNNNRKLIPVLVEPGYVFKADGWLGLLLGSKLYYDVSGSQMEPVILNLLQNEVEGGQGAATVAPPVAAAPKQPVPQNQAEIRQWLSKHEHGREIADMLVGEDLVGVKALEMLSKKSAAELKALLDLNAMQALTLEAALKELF